MDNNSVIEREKEVIDNICEQYKYDSNIRHLLYLIIPAFIIKYGVKYEKLILNTFKNIMIISSNRESKYERAYYSSTLVKKEDEYKTEKYMVIDNYNKISLVELLDSLVHEFNHAVNSYMNEVKVTTNYVYLRTGLTYRIYKKNDLSFLKKHSSYLLEEIINTKQTSDIINIIKGFTPTSKDIETTIYAINSETNNKYNSDSYYLQSYACHEILENKTFISTLEVLRINGEVYDINKWFDDIAGDGSYKELNSLLNEVHELELKYVNQKLFKGITIGKIRDVTRRIMKIVNKFNNNVNFK